MYLYVLSAYTRNPWIGYILALSIKLFHLPPSPEARISAAWSYTTCLETPSCIPPTSCEWMCLPTDPAFETVSGTSLACTEFPSMNMLNPISWTPTTTPPMLALRGYHNPHGKNLLLYTHIPSICISMVKNNHMSLSLVNYWLPWPTQRCFPDISYLLEPLPYPVRVSN